MSAIRPARGYTGRDLILKFTGCYHGHSDALLVKAGSGLLTLGIPNSPGVPAAVAADTLTLPFNLLPAVAEAFVTYRDQIAAIIVEPVAGNMGCIPPVRGFLEGLRDLTSEADSVLIFDEVMTGFRVARGGAQALYNVTPDLTTLGKVIGGGLPVGAFGGRAEIMDHIAPVGNVYQAGTLSGNPVAMAAGTRTLELLREPGVYEGLESKAARLAGGLRDLFAAAEVPLAINRVGSMMTLFFSRAEVTGWASLSASDKEGFAGFFHGMLREGVYLPPSPFEAMFVSTAHTDADLQATLDAARRALDTVDLLDAANKKIGAYSKGMRQRVKIAHSLVNDPDLIILDEPLAGCDPLARTTVMNVVRELGAMGKTVLVSSHILNEIERITEQIIILHNGRLLALGNLHAIRELLDQHPHRILLRTDEPRKLGTAFLPHRDVYGVRFPKPDELVIETNNLSSVHKALPAICIASGVRVTAIENPDDNLESLLGYLMEGRS
mgnify:CR=1 FL=1